MKKDQASIDGFVPRNRASASAKKVDSIEVNKAKTTKRRAAPAKKIATPANEDENLEKILENLEVDDLQNNDQNTPASLLVLPPIFKFYTIEYSIERGNQTRVGTLKICHNNLVASVIDVSCDTEGIGISNSLIKFNAL